MRTANTLLPQLEIKGGFSESAGKTEIREEFIQPKTGLDTDIADLGSPLSVVVGPLS